MIRSHRTGVRVLLISSTALALALAACHKKPIAATAPQPPPPAAATPTASLTADRASINGGESAKLFWNTTNAIKVSITPEVGVVAAHGSTSVTPSASTTYTLTAIGEGGNAESSVRISLRALVATETRNLSLEELFLKDVRDAYFDYDSAAIRPDAREALQRSADFLKSYPSAHVTVEGHCDERGSTEYNIALGDRRAIAVKQYLVNLGVPTDQVVTTSWGKEKPFCTQANETCWQQNRRGHIALDN
jgi:peptidoglycan-associated lipoprotein